MVAWDWDLASGQVARHGDLMGVLGMLPSGASSPITEYRNLIHPDDRASFDAMSQSALDGQSDYRTKYRIVRPDGETRWIADTGRVQRDAEGKAIRFSGVLRDVTEQKQAGDALRQNEAQLRRQANLLETLLDNVPTGISIAEPPDVHLLKISRYGELISGVDSKEVEGRAQSEVSWTIYHADGLTPATQEELPLTRATLHGEVIREEEWVLTHPQTGEKIVLFCNASPVLDEAGNVLMGILAWSDITNLKAAQEDVARLNERLHRAVFESSHRLKNQLQVLTATADMVLMDGQTLVSVEELRRLRSQIGAIATTHDLLTRETQADGTADHIPLKALLERTLAAIQQTTDRHRVRYTVARVLVPLKTATSVALIVNEAVSNAIKHGSKEVDINLEIFEGRGRLEIRDDGPGFPIGFDARRAANTGLELLMTLTRTDLGGEVEFTNNTVCGARIIVTFPLPATR
jgi:PAS domain S-box-containing protein